MRRYDPDTIPMIATGALIAFILLGCFCTLFC